MINDLNALTDTFPPEMFTAPGNVHFKPDGSKMLAKRFTLRKAITFFGFQATMPAKLPLWVNLNEILVSPFFNGGDFMM